MKVHQYYGLQLVLKFLVYTIKWTLIALKSKEIIFNYIYIEGTFIIEDDGSWTQAVYLYWILRAFITSSQLILSEIMVI